MKKKSVILFMVVSFMIHCTGLFSQTGESNFKKVVFTKTARKVEKIKPDFKIDKVGFTDANNNGKIDGKENCTLTFRVKNNGNIELHNLDVKITEANKVNGLSYTENQKINNLSAGDSTLISIPVKSNENLKDGTALFKITIKGTDSDSIRYAQLTMLTKEIIPLPVLTWVKPDSNKMITKFPVVEVSCLLKSKTKISNLSLYVNNEIPDDGRSFEILSGENAGEYVLKRTITLNEGYNELKITAKNAISATTSEPRVINYFVQKIDSTYIEKRLALVIGNADYIHGNALENSINDARAITSALRDVGFTVMSYENADEKTMKKVMDEFGDRLKKYNIGLFYYAGHGIQVKGNNYLIPVDASLKVEQDVDYDCVDAGRLLGKMESAGTTTNIVILDACRDNPFERSWSGRSSSKGSGLAFMNAPSGSIVAYATSPGRTASDGSGRKNGLYTSAILKYIKTPGIPIEEFFKNVRAMVETESEKNQTPWESTSLKGNFYFKLK